MSDAAREGAGEGERDPESRTHVTNPKVLFEVLSPGTEDYDRGEKREHYLRIDSLAAYVIVAQDRRLAETWQREADGSWSHCALGAGDTLELPGISCRLSVDALYREAGLG